MKPKICINGTFEPDEEGVFKATGEGIELNEIESFRINVKLISAKDSTTLCAAELSFVRNAGHGTPEDLLALQLIAGENNRGTKKIFPCEVWLNRQDGSNLGRFLLPRTQITSFSMIDSNNSNPTQTITMLAYELNYIIGSTNAALSDDVNIAPLISKGS